MSVFDRLARESEAERQEWARRNAQTSSESTARVQQDLGRSNSVFDRLEKVRSLTHKAPLGAYTIPILLLWLDSPSSLSGIGGGASGMGAPQRADRR